MHYLRIIACYFAKNDVTVLKIDTQDRDVAKSVVTPHQHQRRHNKDVIIALGKCETFRKRKKT